MNTNKTETAVVTEAPSKMTLAKSIFTGVQGTETPRKSFIAMAQLATDDGGAGLTKAGASTYYQNLKRQAEGGKLYQTASQPAAERAAENAEAVAPIGAEAEESAED